jgi:hypothetical protein
MVLASTLPLAIRAYYRYMYLARMHSLTCLSDDAICISASTERSEPSDSSNFYQSLAVCM